MQAGFGRKLRSVRERDEYLGNAQRSVIHVNGRDQREEIGRYMPKTIDQCLNAFTIFIGLLVGQPLHRRHAGADNAAKTPPRMPWMFFELNSATSLLRAFTRFDPTKPVYPMRASVMFSGGSSGSLYCDGLDSQRKNRGETFPGRWLVEEIQDIAAVEA